MLRRFTDYPKPPYPGDFFYCDPPYVGADQGHYDGYTQDDFDRLLDILSELQGNFLSSSYRNQTLAAVAIQNHGFGDFSL
jgi:DNA adenine methylase